MILPLQEDYGSGEDWGNNSSHLDDLLQPVEVPSLIR